nr:MAG TPA: hypothetical protein [Bacteriophage sp.]
MISIGIINLNSRQPYFSYIASNCRLNIESWAIYSYSTIITIQNCS